jgi:adenine-specific DNA glycosylase
VRHPKSWWDPKKARLKCCLKFPRRHLCPLGQSCHLFLWSNTRSPRVKPAEISPQHCQFLGGQLENIFLSELNNTQIYGRTHTHFSIQSRVAGVFVSCSNITRLTMMDATSTLHAHVIWSTASFRRRTFRFSMFATRRQDSFELTPVPSLLHTVALST